MMITNEVKAAVQQSVEEILDLWWIADSTGYAAKKAVIELVIMKNLAGVKESN
jgi:hypothetical protein